MLATSVVSGSDDLLAYMEQVRAFPMLSEEEERKCAESWFRHGSVSDAHKLVTSHLRLVVKVATGFKSYGLPLMELIMEGNMGLMQAVKKFNPGLGFRLSTYAVWWIKASIKDYILRCWSCMRVGTTQAQKKLFFSLRKIKRKLLGYGGAIEGKDIGRIAKECGTTEKEVETMDRFFSSKGVSLSEKVHCDGNTELQDVIPCPSPNQEVMFLAHEESVMKDEMMSNALSSLDDRHRDIFSRRKLKEDPDTLEKLSEEYGVSKERIRQIELQSLAKIKAFVTSNSVRSGA